MDDIIWGKYQLLNDNICGSTKLFDCSHKISQFTCISGM